MTEEPLQRVFSLTNSDATENLGAALAVRVREHGMGTVIFLQGNLGMGKTTLSRGVMHGLGHKGAVKSPTYTIVEPYEHLTPVAYHFDLYRLGDPEELEYLGIRDYFDQRSLCLIEWAERGQELLPEPDLTVLLEAVGEGRSATVTAGSETGQVLLAGLDVTGVVSE